MCKAIDFLIVLIMNVLRYLEIIGFGLNLINLTPAPPPLNGWTRTKHFLTDITPQFNQGMDSVERMYWCIEYYCNLYFI